MKEGLALGFCAALLALGAAGAEAQTFGQYGGARPIPTGTHLSGAYINASDNLFGVLGQLRLSFYPGVDFGFQGGLARTTAASGNRTNIRLGADLRTLLAGGGAGSPVDLSLGAHLGADIGDGYDILRLGPQLMASIDVPFGQGSMFVPYGGIGVMYSRLDADAGDVSDFSFPLRLGGELRFVPEFRFLGELQIHMGGDRAISDDVEVAAGVNLPF